MSSVLTVASSVQCMHGGTAVLVTTNSELLAGGSPVLLQSDQHPVVGCPFTVGVVYTPCVLIQWQTGAASLSVQGVPVLTQASVGICNSAAGAPQGIAVIVQGSPELSAL